ncbi:MAG: sugar transferase [Cyanobacteria bacterium]|nr:sugar transferase [Cyanobacteriota bacterium]
MHRDRSRLPHELRASVRVAQGLKRVVDFSVSLLGLILTAPIMIIVAAVIGLTMGRPVLFKAERAGLRGTPFTMLKFRTMREAVHDVPDAARLTKTGRVIRRFSLDELPQLWNVLKGDMSLVGPRPLLVRYLPRYTADQRRRHNVRPGITGLAQVSGRNTMGWPEKLALDVWYVDHWSLGLDFKIAARTAGAVLMGRNTTPRTAEIMDEFTG